MPLYDRYCQSCELLQEDLLESRSDDKNNECPNCNRNTLERILSVSHFQITGSNYKNGYS